MVVELMKQLSSIAPNKERLTRISLSQLSVGFWQGDLDPKALETFLSAKKIAVLCFFVESYDVSGIQYLGEVCREWEVWPLPIVYLDSKDTHKMAATDLSDVLVCCPQNHLSKLNQICTQLPKGLRRYLSTPDILEENLDTVLRTGASLGFRCYIDLK